MQTWEGTPPPTSPSEFAEVKRMLQVERDRGDRLQLTLNTREAELTLLTGRIRELNGSLDAIGARLLSIREMLMRQHDQAGG